MGIQSTQYITREDAIERIKVIDALLICKRYLDIENSSYEYDYDVEKWVSYKEPCLSNETDMTQWTDTMLEDKMDEPFYRFSMFDNYLIDEEEL